MKDNKITPDKGDTFLTKLFFEVSKSAVPVRQGDA